MKLYYLVLQILATSLSFSAFSQANLEFKNTQGIIPKINDELLLNTGSFKGVTTKSFHLSGTTYMTPTKNQIKTAPFLDVGFDKDVLTKKFSADLGGMVILQDKDGRVKIADLRVSGKLMRLTFNDELSMKYQQIYNAFPDHGNFGINSGCDLSLKVDVLGALNSDLGNILSFQSNYEASSQGKQIESDIKKSYYEVVKYDADKHALTKVSSGNFHYMKDPGGNLQMKQSKLTLGAELNTEKWMKKTAKLIPYFRLNYTFEQLKLLGSNDLSVNKQTGLITNSGLIEHKEKIAGASVTVGLRLR